MGKPEAALARIGAGTSARRAAAGREISELVERVDWSATAGMLAARRLQSLLGPRIVELAGDRAPEPFVQATRRAIAACAEADGLLELLSLQLTDALETAGIPSLPLKGPGLGRALYGSPGRRPSADIDLLVHVEDLGRAVAVATGLGYREPAPPVAGTLPLLHRRLVHAQPGLPLLELHWRVHWYEQGFSRQMLIDSSAAGPLGRRPSPADELTSLLLFYARDGFVDLKLGCDLGAWWDALAAQLPAGALPEQIARHPALERVLIAAVEVADRVVGLPRLALLGEESKLEPRVRLAMALANPDALGRETQHHADALLVDLLLTPRGGGRAALRRQLQTPSGRPAGQGPPRRSPTGASVDHALRLLRRYALGLRRVARERVGARRHRVTSRP